MKKLCLALAVTLFTFSCTNNVKQEEPKQNQDSKFESFKTNFVERLWKQYPNWASSIGYHKYDNVLTIPGQNTRNSDLAFNKANLDSLKQFDLALLSDNNKTDYHLLEDFFKSSEWSDNILKSHEWNPSQYNVCEGFAEMLNNNYDSLDVRLQNFNKRMAYVKQYYAAAKQNIKNPTKEHTELAISQNNGGSSVFDKDLVDALAKSHLSAEEKNIIQTRAKECIAVIKDYTEWLSKLKNDSPKSFRLGKEVYYQKFDHNIQSGYTAQTIYDKALKRKEYLHGKMFDITKQLWPKYFKDKKMPEDKLIAIREMIDILSVKHVQPDSFQAAIDKQIPELVKFINKKNLIYLDPSKPLVVRKEPAYMAGFAGASISSPGPYDKNGNTYYNVGSMAGWDKERSESYLREYNHYILQILNIHEAIPGHYTQLVYSNKSSSIIKSILSNGAMVEGWAVYSELMMLENGYGAPEGSADAEPEMWLMYYKWNLRSTCNTILDYSIHVNNLAKEDALKLLMNEAFQQKAEAEGKWRRATLSQVQLCSYFTGFTEIYDLREELKQKMGNKFNLKEFHEKFLSYGSAPVKYIRELMLAELK